MQEFTTAARNPQVIEFSLDGEVFTFTPPKMAIMIMPMLVPTNSGDADQFRATMEWLDMGLPEPQQERIAARLKDPADPFDVEPDLGNIIKYLMEQITARPTS